MNTNLRRGRAVYFQLLWLMLTGLMGSTGICRAQIERPSVELNTDIRSRVAGVGKSGTGLYDASARLTAALAPGLRLNIYGNRRYGNLLPQQATLEKQWGLQRLQAGIVRIPFGIYDTRETYASGLIDYPLPRSDYAYNSVDWGAPGVAWSGGSATAQVEAAYFNGRATGLWGNANPVGGIALRAQTYIKGLILGVSRWDGFSVTELGKPQRQDIHETGLDWRFTRPHLLVRGEFLFGSFGDDHTTGSYVDVYYHLPKFAKWTLVGRVETLKPGGDDPTGHQLTLGARYAATPQWIFSLNWRKNNGENFYKPSWTPVAGRSGDWLFQAYHKLHF